MVNAQDSARLLPIYEVDENALEVFTKCRERLHDICLGHLHKPVRVQTVHGQYHEGVIVHIDAYHLYLQVLPGQSRSFFPGYPFAPYYNNVILPLVLFNLLTIALL